jgi:hypothetical protein
MVGEGGDKEGGKSHVPSGHLIIASVLLTIAQRFNAGGQPSLKIESRPGTKGASDRPINLREQSGPSVPDGTCFLIVLEIPALKRRAILSRKMLSKFACGAGAQLFLPLPYPSNPRNPRLKRFLMLPNRRQTDCS